MNTWKRMLAHGLYLFYRLYSMTYRTRFINNPKAPGSRFHGTPVVIGHWHEDDLTLLGPNRNQSYCVLVSQSNDGDLIAYALEKMGYQTVRGSSSRGGAQALVQLIRKIREGTSAVITIDGPLGPRHEAKPGVILLAQKTGVPLITVTARARWRFVFRKTWCQTYLPLPFSPVIIYFDEEPIPVPEGNSAESAELWRIELQDRLTENHKKVEKMLKQND